MAIRRANTAKLGFEGRGPRKYDSGVANELPISERAYGIEDNEMRSSTVYVMRGLITKRRRT